MAIVTVTGGHNSTVALSYDTAAASNLAAQLAYLISQGVQTGAIEAAQGPGLPPHLPANTIGQWVQTQPGVTVLPTGYTNVTVADSVNGAAVNPGHSLILGSGGANEAVLLGNTSVTFQASAGSGTVVGGGGNDLVVITASNPGQWDVTLGGGDDTVYATGSGLQLVNAGPGHNQIVLGAGSVQLQLNGDDTVFAGSGSSTITAAGDTRALVHGASGDLVYIGGSEAATVLGGSGSETLFGGSGTDVFQGGSGNDAFFAGTGSETVTGGSGANVFDFVKGRAGGHELITNFNSAEQLTLTGYASGSVASVAVVSGSTVITLSDSTQITLQNFTGLKPGSNINYN